MHDDDFAFANFVFVSSVNSKFKFSVKMTQLYYINNSCIIMDVSGRRRSRITLKMVSLEAELNFGLFRLLI